MDSWKLCDSEYRFMNVVWDSAPVPSGELVALCARQLGWKKSTTYTMVKKLAQKGLLRNENAVVTALVPREDVQAEESAAFVERTFGGSLPAFLAAFMFYQRHSVRYFCDIFRLDTELQPEQPDRLAY